MVTAKRGHGVAAAAVTLGAVLATAACDGNERPAATGTTSRTVASAPPTPADCAMPALGPVDPSSVLRPGPSTGVPHSDATGEQLVVVAVVLDAACRPAASAGVHLWHTDARGKYGPAPANECCYYQGDVRTDEHGRFRVETVRPGRYAETDAPPSHIHLEIRHASGHLDTELLFLPDASARARLRPSGDVAVRLAPTNGAWYGEAGFVLEP
jgi:protocatechuate 3,4-dioxygenase beta subunit